MTFATATIAPIKYLHIRADIKSIYKRIPYPNPNPHIKLNLKPYHNPNPNPKFLGEIKNGATVARANVSLCFVFFFLHRIWQIVNVSLAILKPRREYYIFPK